MKSSQRVYYGSESQDREIRERSRQKPTKDETRKGRPFKYATAQISNQQIQNRLHSSDEEEKYATQIQEKLIDFLQAIGESKGFIYSPSERKTLKDFYRKDSVKNRKFIPWTSQQKWNRSTQIKTMQKVCQRQLEAELRHRFERNGSLRRILIEAGCILAQEFTQQFYQVCIGIFKIICKSQENTCDQSQHFSRIDLAASSEANTTPSKALDKLAEVIRTDTKKFYLISLQFQEGIKIFQRKQKRQIDRKTTYATLVHDLYHVVLPLVE